MQNFDSLGDFVSSLNDHNLEFLFVGACEGGYCERNSLKTEVEKLAGAVAGQDRINRIFTILLNKGGSGAGQCIEDMEAILKESGMPQAHKERVLKLLDIALARVLRSIASDRARRSHPQNLRHILSYFSGRRAHLLLIIESLLHIIAREKDFAIQERARASRVLVNNYHIEAIFIYLATDAAFTPEKRKFVFSWLTAYQKVFRKIQEIIYDTREDKLKAAETWFDISFKELKKAGRVPVDDHTIPPFVDSFIEHAVAGNQKGLEAAGRALVLMVNNEDTLWMVQARVGEMPEVEKDPVTVKRLYYYLYTIMQEYREICEGEAESLGWIGDNLSVMSQEIRESEYMVAAKHRGDGKTPILGELIQHGLLPETAKNLEESNLTHLFEIWPIPVNSQKIFNTICLLKDMIPSGREYMVNHFLYREKVLEFLMRLERIGIKVIKADELPLMTNSVQLNAMNFFKEGVYLGSTGHWNGQNRKPPSVICCTKPHALGNCIGQALRHVVLRVFLGTGEFYESPFVLDSTQRFGQMDEEGGAQALIMRPGLFLLDIPEEIRDVWKNQQERQMKLKLGQVIDDRIKLEA